MAADHDPAHTPPRMSLWRVVRQFLPSVTGCLLWLVAVVVMAAAVGLAAALSLAIVDGNGERNPGVALFLLSVLVVPAVALFILAAAATSARAGARALLLLTASGVLMIGTYSCGRGMIALDTAPAPAWAWSAASYGSLALIAAAGALALLAFTPHWVRRDLEHERHGYVGRIVAGRGSVAMAELAASLGIPLGRLRGIVIDLVTDGQLHARIDDRSGRVFTVDHLSSQQARLAQLIVDRGRERISRLADDLGEPPQVVEGWVDELMIAGVLEATVDRARELVIWAPLGDGAASSPRRELNLRSCSSCGGPLRAVGGGLFRCVYCAAELEVEEA